MTAHLVYQAYGLEEIRTQALYAAHSALAWRGDLDLVVHLYVDDAAPFAALRGPRLEIHELSRERIREWRGPCDFTHRLKAVMIADLVARHPGEPLLYLDCDTFWTGPVAGAFERVGPGRAVMHVREYPVATTSTGQMKRFRRNLRRLSFEGRPVDLDGWMWCAGAIGMDPAQFPLVPRWIRFIDEIYPQYSKGLVEQYSISLLLQRSAELQPIDDLVVHYWAQKDDYVAAIRGELATLAALGPDAAGAHVRANRIALPPPAVMKHQKKGLLARLFGR